MSEQHSPTAAAAKAATDETRAAASTATAAVKATTAAAANATTATATADTKLPWRVKLGYGTIGLANIANVMLVTWQLYFFTTFAGLNVAVAGIIISAGQIVAAFMAPVWGYVSDRLYDTALGRRFGRRKATLLLTIPGLFAFYLVMFIPGLPVGVYAAANLLYWAINGGYSTIQYVLPAEMSESAGQRAQLVGVNQIAMAIAATTLATINTYLFTAWGQDRWQTFFLLALIYGVLTTLALVAGLVTISERPHDETTDFTGADAEQGERLSVPRRLALLVWNYASTFSVREFRNYLGMYISEIMFRAVRGSILAYFLIFALGLNASEVSLSRGITLVFGIALVGFFIWLNAKIGGASSYRVGAAEAIVVFLLMFGLAQVHAQIGRAATIGAWIALALALNFGITGCVNACDFAYSFIPDVDEALTGKRREGQFASVNSTIDNIFMAIENIAITSALSAVGFVSKATTQPPTVTAALTAIFCFVPIVFCVIGIFFSFRVRLNEQNRSVLSAEIARLRAGGSKADVTPEARELVEAVTGYPYEQCWGNNRVVNFAHVAGRGAAVAGDFGGARERGGAAVRAAVAGQVAAVRPAAAGQVAAVQSAATAAATSSSPSA